MKSILAILVLGGGVLVTGSARALTLDGDARSLTLVVEENARNEIVAAIAQRFSMKVSGAPISSDLVSGRFTGTLGHVLKLVLPDNGFAIAYENGLPARIVFTGGSSGTSGFSDSQPSPQMPPAPVMPASPSTGAEL